nr:T9SS type A sorting domain-containing protein [Bacteroidota bacterium]
QVQSPGACHVYTVEQSYSNPDVIYCGTATAGMYRSNDKGMTWTLITRDLPVTGVYSIAISETDEDVVFLGSGNGHLYRSDDGGENWTLCGDEAYTNTQRWYRTLMITEEGIFAATDNGLWFSNDMGETMQQISQGEFMELEQHPTAENIIYTVKLQGGGTRFMRSLDGGMNFEYVGDGWPETPSGNEQKRTEIAVSEAEPDAVFALASGDTPEGGGLYGYYVSHDAGSTFEMACCGDTPGGPWIAEENPNILGWGEDGSSDGGQYYYDLALGASPTDASKQFAAGICVWRTETGGEDWDLNAHWVTWAGEYTADRYTHADVHDVKFFKQEDGTVDMWVASDGGLYYSSDEGDNIEPRMYGLHGTDFWGWQAGWRAKDVMVGGTYHNGTLIRNGDLYHYGAPLEGAASDTSGGWLAELAGDNYRGFVNPGDPTVGYSDNGAFGYTEDRFERISGLAFDDSKVPNASYWFGEVGNFEWDPTCYNRFYSPVGSELWRTDNGGVTWELVHDFLGDKIISVKIPPTSPNTIYVSHKYNGGNWRIHKSIDFGVTWENITITNAESDYNGDRAIYLDTDGTNPDRLYAILLGTQDGYQVFESQDAGDTWQNLTTATLNDEHVISIAHQRGTEGGLYLGTTRAVYYRDDSMTDWELFNAGLPVITPATFLQPDYCGGTIRTAGSRSVHESPFYSPSSVQAGFMADRTEINLATPCNTPPVHFSDVSVVRCEGAEYVWSFEGGEPVTAIGPDAYVNYIEVGEFDVTLTVTDVDGVSGSITWTDLVSVTSNEVASGEGFAEDFDGEDFPPAHWRMETPGHAWEHAYDLLDATNGVAQFPNYWVETNGAHDKLITPGFNPTQIENLSFDYAHAQYAAYEDGLQVVARLAGETDWTVLWERYGADLSVEDCYTWFWYDTEGEVSWETVTLDVPSHWDTSGAVCAEIAFVNVGGYGNHTWIDNVMVGSPVGVDIVNSHLDEIMIYPNPTTGLFTVKIHNSDATNFYIFDSLGKLVEFGEVNLEVQLDLSGLSEGLYHLAIPGYSSKRIILQSHRN